MSADYHPLAICRLTRIVPSFLLAFAAPVVVSLGAALEEAPKFAAPAAAPTEATLPGPLGAGQAAPSSPASPAADLPGTDTTPAGPPSRSPAGDGAGQLPDMRFRAPQPAGDAAPGLPSRDAIPPGTSDDEGYRSLFRGIDGARPKPDDGTAVPPAAGPGDFPRADTGAPPDTGTLPPAGAATPPAGTLPPAVAEPESFGTPPAASADLLTQLRDTLREREAAIRDQYATGQATLTDLLAATDEVFRAEHALKGNSAQRQQLCRKYIDNLKGFEAKLEPVVNAGSSRYTRADYLAVKATRLRAEIQLTQDREAPAYNGGIGSFPGQAEETR